MGDLAVKKRRWFSPQLATAVIGVGLIAVLAFASLRVLGNSGGSGWSRDVIFDDGSGGPMMDVRLQFKTEPDPPIIGTQTVMFKVKGISGMPMLVDRVRYTITKDDGDTTGAGEAVPVGEFDLNGRRNGSYTATIEIPSLGRYLVELQVQHGASDFKASWPLDVKAGR